MTDCPARWHLQRLLDGELDGEPERAVSAHLESCPRCQQVLEELTSVGTTIRPPGPCSSPARRGVSDSQLRRLRGLLPGPGSAELPALPAVVTWPAVPGYEVLRELGRGGMAVVYEARQLRLNRLVALKMIRPGELATPEKMVRFCAEGETVARLRHPNIVQIHEVGTQDGRPYLALEMMDGGSLSDALKGSLLPARAAARLVAALAGATEYAHRQGVIHRDLNPANVLLPAPGLVPETLGVAKITDFGLAKHLGHDSRLTQAGFVMGTPSYMAPEQVRGQNERVGPAADVYALGAILYECLTGRPPFLAATPLETMRQVAELDPVPPARLLPQVPRDVEVICLKCLEKEPARRYASAGLLAEELERFLAGEPIRARRIDTLERAWRWARRRPAVAGLLLALALTLLAGSGLSTYFAVESAHRADLAQGKEREAEEARAQSARLTADLLLDRGLKRAAEGQVAEGLHWMLASLRASPDADFRRLVRIHLASWGARVPALGLWIDTPHRAAAFGPEGRLLATAGRAGAVDSAARVGLGLWDLRDGRPVGELIRTDDRSICALTFSPDGRTLMAGNGAAQAYQGNPGWATRWDVAARRIVGRSRGHTDCVLCAAWAPDGRQFFTGSRDRTVRAWDAATGKQVGRLLAHPGEVRQLAVSPEGRWLLARSEKTAHLWDLSTGEPVGEPLRGADESLTGAAFADGGRTLLLVSALPGGTGHRVLARGWDPATRRLTGEARVVPHPAGGEVGALPDGRAVAFDCVSADGRLAAVMAGGVQVWRLPRDRSLPLVELPRPGKMGSPLLLAARWAPDGARVWVPLEGAERVQAWDVTTRQPVGAAVPHAPSFGTTRLAVSPDGTLVATVPPQAGTPTGVVARVWEVATGRPAGPPLAHANLPLALAFDPRGKVLATGGHVRSLHLWDATTGRLLGERLPQGDMIRALDFSADGKAVAVGTCGREVRVWDVAGQKPLLPPLVHDDEVGVVRFSPDGSRLAAACAGAAHLWDAHTGRKVASLPFARPVPEQRIAVDACLLFSPDGKALLTSGGYGSFRLWDAATGRPLGPPTPLGEVQLSCFAFSPGGRLLVAGHEGGKAQVWEAATLRPLGAPVEQPPGVTGVAFAPEGGSFLTVAADGTIRSWPVPAPLEGDEERIALSVQLSTGLRLDDGRAVVPLTRGEWEGLRKRWRERGGEADWAIGPPVADEDWHEARARDAEQTGRPFTARWHLDSLVAARPGDGRLYLRRARTWSEEGRWEEAGLDYRRALRHAPAETLRAWYRHRSWACQARGRWSAARWYLDQLLATQPDDRELLRRRAEVTDKIARKASGR